MNTLPQHAGAVRRQGWRRALGAGLVALAGTVLGGAVPALRADTQGTVIIDGRVSELRRLIEDIRQEINDLRAQLLAAEDKLSALRRQVAAAQQNVDKAQTALNRASADWSAARSDVLAQNLPLDKLRRDLAAARDTAVGRERLSPDYRQAQDALAAAQATADRLKETIRQEVAGREDYQQAHLAYLRTAQRWDTLQKQEGADPQAVAQARIEMLQAESPMNKFWQEALAANADYQTAQEAQRRAALAAQVAQGQVKERADMYPAVMEVRQQLADQQGKVAQARAVVDSLLQRRRELDDDLRDRVGDLALARTELDTATRQRERLQRDLDQAQMELNTRQAQLWLILNGGLPTTQP